MRISHRFSGVVLATIAILVALSASVHAVGIPGLGFLAGMETGGENLFLGGQAEFGPVVGPSYLVPSVYVSFGDASTTTANLDLRWYLLNLPDLKIAAAVMFGL